ncbi:MAG: hypothetical protein AAB833_00840 [Patescibacteria group bacterium]
MSKSVVDISSILFHWPKIFLFGILGAVIVTLLSLINPLEYSSRTQILITQELGPVDSYTASRSSERIAEDLANIVYTSTFFEKVMSSGYNLDATYFPEDPYKLRKKWGKTISATVVRGSGLLSIKAYHSNRDQAEELTRAVAFILTTQGWTYTSGGSLRIQIVDEPLNSKYPARPNLPLNAASGLVLGSILSAIYIFLKHQNQSSNHQLVHL